MKRGVDPFVRAMDRFSPEPMSGCWLWLGCVGGYGYGHIKYKTKTLAAHRVVYEGIKGAIPSGYQIDHKCRNTLCVNPDHLEAVTQKENILRGVGASAVHAKKTHCKRGHPFTPDNTMLVSGQYGNSRVCKTCRRAIYWRNK